MSDRPTPETDAAASPNIGFYSCATVTANFARRLEIERDEAREHLEHVKEYGTEEINAAVDLRQKLAQALVELDNMQDQRDLAMKVISRLERERDKAREEAHRFRSLHYNHLGINASASWFPWEEKLGHE
jgi:uncharacterized protein (DUF3084 family)